MTVQGGHWGARREIVDRSVFSIVQALEVIGAPPAGVEVEASFDEYNLDIRIRYVGDKIIFPDHRPDPRQIAESEEGERLFAGYLLAQTADRISCRAEGKQAELLLHYDH
jgi:hypothetical protein